MKIAVVGATGIIGSGTVMDLLSKHSEKVDGVLVVGRNSEKVKQFVASLKDSRAEARVADALDRQKLREILKDADACVNAAQYHVNIDVMEACLEAKCHYLDLGGMFYTTLKQKELHGRFVEKDVAAILGLGSAPGTTNIAAKYAADQLDTVEKVNIFDGIKFLGQESPVFVPPYSILTLLEEYSVDSMQFYDGEFRKMPACSGEEVVDFPEPIGKIGCFHTLHSEIATLPYSLKEKGVKEVTWKLGQPDDIKRIVKALVSIGFGDIKTLKVKDVTIDLGEFLAALIRMNIDKNKYKIAKPKSLEESQPYEIIRAAVEGKKEGRKVKYVVDVIREPNDFYANIPDPATSMPASIGSQMLAEGEIAPGVWAPEECVDITKYFKEMKRRKFKIESHTSMSL